MLSAAIIAQYDLDAMPKSLLNIESNPKLAKGDGAKYLTAGLMLAPYKLSGRNLCSHASVGCAAACLNTAGQGGIGLDKNGLNHCQIARIRRARYFTRDRKAFMLDLVFDIERLERRAIRNGQQLCVRLNVLSDLPWENIPVGAHPNIMAMFPGVQFYDYTKVPLRIRRHAAAIPNYHLTFSLSESNDDEAFTAALTVNVAVAMSVAKRDTLPRTFTLRRYADDATRPTQEIELPVIDGDKTDLRFTDPRGCIVGLRAKGSKGKADTTGFVRNVSGAIHATA